ncbi:MAG: hypothetical protein HCAMLNBO_00687 [Candidatus Brocadia fulgida]|nr:hypothetical protein [Candidatus Brocadia fulgida]
MFGGIEGFKCCRHSPSETFEVRTKATLAKSELVRTDKTGFKK